MSPLQYAARMAKYLVIGLAILYALDWIVLEIRLARGTGMGNVAVEEYLQTPLKGSKVEYDYLGTAGQNCSRTAFPQYAASALNLPCWWLKRHNQQWQ